MITTKKLRLLCAALFLLLAGGLASPSLASELDDLRQQGLVGETQAGYAEARSGASDAVKDLVATINEKRRSLYEQRAKETGATAEQVGQVYAKEIIDDLPAGSWVKTSKGWEKK